MAKDKKARFRSLPKKCVYCGQPAGTTRDHVPPKSLFLEPIPKQLITVPACEACNGGFSELDTAFKEWLGFALGVSDAQGSRYWNEKLLPTVWNNERRRKEIVDGLQLVRAAMPNRAEPVEMHVLNIKASIQEKMIARLVRGLWFKEHREIFPSHIQIRQSLFANSEGFEDLSKKCQWRHFDGQFRYGFRLLDGLPWTSCWLFLFHGGHFTLAFTGEAARLLHDDESVRD